jgi:hypothetical protein
LKATYLPVVIISNAAQRGYRHRRVYFRKVDARIGNAAADRLRNLRDIGEHADTGVGIYRFDDIHENITGKSNPDFLLIHFKSPLPKAIARNDG